MPLLYSLTLFTSATLLFLVQPMVGKMLLPLLGGSPAVWNTCLVFFQAALLAGYLYAHLSLDWFGPRRQAALHLTLLAGTLAALGYGWTTGGVPFGVSEDAAVAVAGDADPTGWVFRLLTVVIGLPFFAVAASAPLLQRWFADTGHPAGRDPYFLYAASNAGSMLALLSYPFFVELWLPTQDQSRWWAAGFGLLFALTTVCAVALWRSPPPAAAEQRHDAATPPTAARKARWVLLAFVPSSLLMGVTNYLSTEVLSHPVLWIVPLALYLLTFILVFAARPPLPHALVSRWLPPAAVLLAILLATKANEPTWLIVAVNLLTFFLAAMVAHGELAADRPPPAHLTGFYLWLSFGGVLGGLFNALAAPLLFRHVGVAEYPLALVLACLLRPADRGGRPTWADLAWPVGVGAATAALIALVPTGSDGPGRSPLANVVYGLPAAALLFTLERPVRFGLCLGAILLASQFDPSVYGRTLVTERNFFGVLRVTRDTARDMNLIVHGNTLHSLQSLDPKQALLPTAYYFPNGPVSQIFEEYGRRPTKRTVAVAGLGAGGIACYAKPGEKWTFYEIDPAMKRVAEDPAYFTFLRDCFKPPESRYEVLLGDARLRMREAEPKAFGLVVLNAFNSSSPPMHLLTREAMELYLDKVADGGLLVYNVSNRHLDLRPVLAAQAKQLGLAYRTRSDAVRSIDEWRRGKESCAWVVLARSASDLGGLADAADWSGPPAELPAVWTDDYSNLLSMLKWR